MPARVRARAPDAVRMIRHDPSKAFLVRPLPARPTQPTRWWQRTVPPWTVLSLIPIAAIALGAVLANVGTP